MRFSNGSKSSGVRGLRGAAEEDRDRLQRQVDALQALPAELEEERGLRLAGEQERDSLREQLAAAERSLGDVQELAASREHERACLMQEVEELEADKTRLKSRVAEVEQARLRSQALIQGEVASLTQQVVGKSEENSQLREQVTKLGKLEDVVSKLETLSRPSAGRVSPSLKDRPPANLSFCSAAGKNPHS